MDKEKILTQVIEEILEKRFSKKVKDGSIPEVIFTRDEYKIGIERAITLTEEVINREEELNELNDVRNR